MKKLLSLSFIILVAQIASAQTAATNTGILYISGSTDIFYAANDFTNNSGSLLTNNGQLYVKGNLSNAQASMAIGTGLLTLNGTAAQAVNGTQAFKTFNLTTNNSAGITLNNNLSVSGAHTFTAGNIASSATPNFLVYEAGSSYSSAADGKSVTGWVKKMGTTDFIFPVGNATYLRTIAVSNLSVNSEFDATYSGVTTNTSSVTAPVATVNQFEHWTLNKQTGGTAQVTLNWDKTKVSFPAYSLSDILSSKFMGSWVSTGGTATGNVTTNGSIMSTAQSAFGAFVIASTLQSVPLHFLTIKATRINEQTSVVWKTANEENVAWHEIQKSTTANDFYTMAKVTAKNLREQTYEFKDSSYLNGTAYYRIKSVDRDHKFNYSGIVSVTQKNGFEGLKLLVNPVKTQIIISGGKPYVNYRYGLFSMDGKLVQSGSFQANTNLLSIRIRGSIFPGSYLFKIEGKGEQLSKKIIIE